MAAAQRSFLEKPLHPEPAGNHLVSQQPLGGGYMETSCLPFHWFWNMTTDTSCCWTILFHLTDWWCKSSPALWLRIYTRAHRCHGSQSLRRRARCLPERDFKWFSSILFWTDVAFWLWLPDRSSWPFDQDSAAEAHLASGDSLQSSSQINQSWVIQASVWCSKRSF